MYRAARLINVVCSRMMLVQRTKCPLQQVPALYQTTLVSLCRQYSVTDSTDIQETSVDKRLQKLLQQWDIDNAVGLVVSEMKSNQNSSLSGNGVCQLLEHLSEIGDTDQLLYLEETVLRNGHLILPETYYYHLSEAFINSGQLDEGIGYLKTICVGNYDREQINVIFTLLAVSSMQVSAEATEKYFKLILYQVSVGDYYLAAVLWKCYVLTGQFNEADKLLSKYEDHIKSQLPVMVNEICQMKDKIKAETLQEEMLLHLMKLPQLRKKKQNILLYRTLLQILYTESRWSDLLRALVTAKDAQIELPKDVVSHYLRTLHTFSRDCGDLDNSMIEQIEVWRNNLT